MHNRPFKPSQDSRLLLYDRLKKAFSLAELHELCFECRIDDEDIPGLTKTEKIVGLIEYCQRHNTTPQLLVRLRAHRPDIDWPDISTIDQPFDQSNPQSSTPVPPAFSEIRAAYLDYVINRHTLAGLPMPFPIGLRLADLFVPPRLQRHDSQPTLNRRNEPSVLTFGEAIQTYSRLTILGQPGSGKSMLLQFLALHHAQASKMQVNLQLPFGASNEYGPTKLPFLMDLADAAQEITSSQSLIDCMCQSLAPDLIHINGLGEFAQWFKAALNSGHAILLLDGFDRISTLPQRDRVLHEMDQLFASIHPDTGIVLTSRDRTSLPLPASLNPFAICGLNSKQMRQLMTRWFTAIAKQGVDETTSEHARDLQIKKRAGSLLTVTRTTPALRWLSKTPENLVLLLIHSHYIQPLPRQRTALVRHLLNTSLNDEATQKLFPTTAELGKVVCLSALSKLAHWMLVAQRNMISEDQALAQIHELLAAESELSLSSLKAQALARSVLQHLVSQTGLLTLARANAYSDSYTFAFSLLRDYLVAHALLWQHNTPSQIKAHRDDPRWQDVLVLAVGQASANDPVLAQRLVQQAILDADADLAPRKSLLLATRCLSECEDGLDNNWLRSVAQSVSELWVSAGLADDFADTLATIFSASSGSEFAHCIALDLVDKLDEANVHSQVRMVFGLGQLGCNDDKIKAKLLRLLSHTNAAVRQTTAKSLGLLGQPTPAVTAGLVAALNDSALAVRRVVIQSLGNLASPDDDVTPQLMLCLDDPKLCDAAAEALTTLFGADETLMLTAIERLRTAQTREGGLALLQDIAALDPSLVERQIASLIHDQNHEIRKSAIWLIQRLGFASDVIVDALLERLQDDKVRRSAAEALVRIHHKNLQRIVSGLEQLRHNSDNYVQRIANESLGRIRLSAQPNK